MKETIFLVVSPWKVERMTKTLPALNRGQIPVKLELEVDEKAFREPVITQKVYINDWRDGIDIADIEFKESVITPEEVEMIKERRLAKMAEILQAQGYTVEKAEDEDIDLDDEA